MTAWLEAIPALLIAVALATLPGLPAAWALRFRGLGLLAVSIGASFAIIAVASLILPLAGVRLGILPVLGIAAVVTLAALALRRLLPGERPARPAGTAPYAVAVCGALLLAAALIGWVIARAFGDPAHPSQNWDVLFHLNSVAQILSTGDASPLHMNVANPLRSTVFYPNLWHVYTALVAQLAGSGIAVASNTVSLVISAWVWPVAILFFAAPFFARRPMHLVLAGVLASVFPTFPYLFLAWGSLNPNQLSTALIPIALGAAHLALRRESLAVRGADTAVGGRSPLASLWIAAAGAAAAAVLAQPNALFGMAALVVPLLVAVAFDTGRAELPRAARLWRWAGLIAVAIAIAVLWVTISVPFPRSYDRGLPGGIVDAIGYDAPRFGHHTWLLTALTLTGAALLLATRRHRWLLGSYAVVVVLYAVTVGLNNDFSSFLTGGWYSDAARIAALLPIVGLPLAGAAGAFLIDLVLDGPRRMRARTAQAEQAKVAEPSDDAPESADRPQAATRPPLSPLRYLAVAVILLLVVLGARGSVAAQGAWIAEWHVVGDSSEFLSPDELALLQRLDREVPEDALIAGDPLTGTAYAYALSGRKVLFPYMGGNYSPAATELATELRDLPERAACSLLGELGVTHVLDFRGHILNPTKRAVKAKFAGLRKVGDSPALERIDREGKASLYRVAC